MKHLFISRKKTQKETGIRTLSDLYFLRFFEFFAAIHSEAPSS